MKKVYVLLLLVSVFCICNSNAQESLYISNPDNVYLGNDLAITLAGGATVAQDTLAYDDTLYVRGGELRGYYLLKRIAIDGGGSVFVDSASGSNDTTEIMITGGVRVDGGSTLHADSQITIISNVTGTGRVEELTTGNSIVGNVTIQRYIPGGRRAYRFFSHPFTSSQTISSMLQDDIDVTGAGGSTNGFTNTFTNNSSAWYFDATVGDTSTVTPNPGWKAFASANIANWDKYQCIYLMIRGAKGEGLTGQSYTPSEITIDVTGLINQGDQVVSLSSGVSGGGFNLLGNPYPSHINLKDPLNNMSNKRGAAFWVMNTNLGSKGGYEAVIYNTDYWLPSNSGIAVDISASTSITFKESHKVDTGRALFKTTGLKDAITFEVYSDSQKIYWDKMYIMFNPAADKKHDDYDAVKYFNGEVDMYALAGGIKPVSVDGRPFVDNEIIPINFDTKLQNTYELHVADYTVTAGNIVQLYDKHLKKTTVLKPGSVYKFDVTGDSLSAGARFQLGLSVVSVDEINKKQTFTLYPNPVIDKFFIDLVEPVNNHALLTITDVHGRKVLVKELDEGEKKITQDVSGWSSGVYYIDISENEKTLMSSKFVKLAK